MSRILALDIALRTGYAHDGARPGVPVTGIYDCRSTRGDFKTGYHLGETFEMFRRWLIRTVDEVKPHEIVFEAPVNILHGIKSNQQTVRVLFGLAAMAEAVAYELDFPISEGNIGAIKKHFAGTARAQKPDMVARCKQLGWDIGMKPDHNRADAAALWSMTKSIRDPKWSPMSTPLFARAAQ